MGPYDYRTLEPTYPIPFAKDAGKSHVRSTVKVDRVLEASLHSAAFCVSYSRKTEGGPSDPLPYKCGEEETNKMRFFRQISLEIYENNQRFYFDLILLTHYLF